MSNGKFLAGILLGAAAGAVLGVLFAPEKGTDTRKKISKKTGKLGDDLKAKFDEMSDSIKQKFDSIREDANDMMDKSKTAQSM
ncbi:MAG: YtxH domain-containing protein [Chitinophagaceae bacterium]|nr:MAG: YtxH domain-containing protein [Chitinophagaceae bacterium]